MRPSEESKPELQVFHLSKMNKNPRLYKYYWWVVPKADLPVGFQRVEFSYFPVGPSKIPMTSWVSTESKEQSGDLHTYVMENFEKTCLFDALKRMAELEGNNQPYVAVKEEFPRLGSPFDPKHDKWKNREFAIAFDEDGDPIVDGHK